MRDERDLKRRMEVFDKASTRKNEKREKTWKARFDDEEDDDDGGER